LTYVPIEQVRVLRKTANLSANHAEQDFAGKFMRFRKRIQVLLQTRLASRWVISSLEASMMAEEFVGR
jgi:hypothetical protein